MHWGTNVARIADANAHWDETLAMLSMSGALEADRCASAPVAVATWCQVGALARTEALMMTREA